MESGMNGNAPFWSVREHSALVEIANVAGELSLRAFRLLHVAL